MRPSLVLTVILAAGLGTPGLAQDQSGRFPVFGPSAEREAFFQSQRDAEAERVARLEEQRREAELARELARQQAAALSSSAQDTDPGYRRIVRRCYLTKPTTTEEIITDDGGGQNAPFALRVRESNLPGRVVCPNYVFVPVRPNRTNIAINVDDGDVSGRVRIRRPGLNIDLEAD